ncbi:hypothetical protein SHIRM173S_12729 [Streptomyces hirsutus]
MRPDGTVVGDQMASRLDQEVQRARGEFAEAFHALAQHGEDLVQRGFQPVSPPVRVSERGQAAAEV